MSAAKKETPTHQLRVTFACNDHRNGMFQGWFDAVSIEAYEAEIDGQRMRMTFLQDNKVRIGRKVFKHEGVAEWVGNWCWDEIRIVDGDRLLWHLRESGFRCSTGHAKFFKWFNR